jgi:WD40 repeat protein
MLVLQTAIRTVTGLAFSRAGNRLAAGGDRAGVAVWDLDRPGEPPVEPAGWRLRLPTVAFAADGLLIGDYLSPVSFDPQTGRARPVLSSAPLGTAGLFAVGPDGRRLVIGRERLAEDVDAYHAARLDGDGWRSEWTAPAAGYGTGRAVAFLGTGTHVVAAEDGRRFPPDRSTQSVLVVMDAATGELVKQHTAPVKRLTAVATHPTGRQVVAAGQTVLNIWDDPVDGSYTRRVNNDGRRHFTAVAYHPGGRLLAATSNDETVKLYDTKSWKVAKTFTWEAGKLRSVAFSPDGTRAAVGGDAGRVVVWDVDE